MNGSWPDNKYEEGSLFIPTDCVNLDQFFCLNENLHKLKWREDYMPHL